MLHPVREMHGMVVMWHHTQGLAPDHEPYIEARIDSEPGARLSSPVRLFSP